MVSRWRTALMLAWLVVVAGAEIAWPTGAGEPDTITITMQGREFAPATVVLPIKRKVRLELMNNDPELHAFVPVGLLDGVSVAIGGNGAPEFGPGGFKRVIVPSGGRVDLVFT